LPPLLLEESWEDEGHAISVNRPKFHPTREWSMIILARKSLIALAALCILLLSSTVRFKVFVKAQNGDLIVDPQREGPGIFKTIQEAIDNASAGQTIFVVNGTYYENLVIYKSNISLVGQNRDGTIIDGSQFSDVISIFADNVTVKGFHIRNSGVFMGSGIRIEHANGNFITSNTLTDNFDGVAVQTSSSNIISNNVIANSSYGIRIYISSDNRVSGNTVSFSAYDGVRIDTSSSNVVSNNSILNNYDGLGLYSSKDNLITGNVIRGNSDGIALSTSTNNTVTRNLIDSNNHGIVLAYGGINNVFYRNNLNNNPQVYFQPSISILPNSWNFMGEGNFWSDYNGTDADADGVGDTPYYVDQHNVDHDPLMGRFSDYYPSLHTELFQVDMISNATITDFNFEVGNETGNRIISFNVGGHDENGFFCRIGIPNSLMIYQTVLLVGEEEVIPKNLNSSNSTYLSMYFSYPHSNRTVLLISSKTLYLISEILDKYLQLQADLGLQNDTYNVLLSNYSRLWNSYDQLKQAYDSLKSSYESLLRIQSEDANNNQNLMYVIGAGTAIFLCSIVYLSKRAHEKTSAQP